MKVIILAGGYGIRLQEDIKNLEATNLQMFKEYTRFLGVPKPLLDIGGKPILTRIMEKLERASLRDITIRANDANIEQFNAWKKSYHGSCAITIISDGSPENKHGQGVFGGVLFMIEQRKIDEDILILAGDTIFDYDLAEVLAAYEQNKKTTIAAHKERPEFIRQRGVVQYDDKKRIISYEEKPAEPKSIYAATPTFIFDKECTRLIKAYMQETTNDNNMGNIVPWLLKRGQEMYVFLTEKEIFDVGNVESIRLAEEFLKRR